MSTLGWILLAAGAWATANAAFVAVLSVTRARREPKAADVQATGELACRLAEDVLGVLGVERVAVVMHDADGTGTGIVEACCGRTELVGATVPVTGGFGWGAGPESRFLIEDRFDAPAWAVVSVPIAGERGVVGTVAVATNRERGLAARDVELLERLSRRAAAHSDRRVEPIDRLARFERGLDRDIAA
jgi:GAF domain